MATELKIPRYMLSVEVFDNETQEHHANVGFNCSHLETIAERLRGLADKLELLSREEKYRGVWEHVPKRAGGERA